MVYTLSSLVLVMCLFSCEKYLQVDPPNDKLETASAFVDSTAASSVITGIYSDISNTNTGFLSFVTRLNGLAADEIKNPSVLLGQFQNNSVQVDNSQLNGVWVDFYKHIYQANAAIEGIQKAPNITASAKGGLIGEAKFLRAFCFFYLVNLWGDVPLTTSTDYRINEKMPRNSVVEVYGQILDDLKSAQQSLPEQYLVAERVRANKYAATALLARVYLYLKDWPNAEAEATKLISNGSFLPLPSLASTFTKDSKETIWQIFPGYNILYNTYDGSFFVPSPSASVIPQYTTTDQLNNSFEVGDNRKTSWIGNKVVSGVNYSYPFKYKLRSATTPTTEYTVALRLSEQLLIRAEARAQRNSLPEAIDDINLLRVRAGLTPLVRTISINKEDLLNVIYRERQVELFAEWGHRWLDLKRLNKATEILQPIKGANWQNTDVVWPIPVAQILTNPALNQNSGY